MFIIPSPCPSFKIVVTFGHFLRFEGKNDKMVIPKLPRLALFKSPRFHLQLPSILYTYQLLMYGSLKLYNLQKIWI